MGRNGTKRKGLDFWRARGEEREPSIEVDDPAGEGEGTGWLEE
jgi:hypothetical protein